MEKLNLILLAVYTIIKMNNHFQS